MPTIKVRSRGDALVPDYKQLFNGVKRFVGWRHDPNLGDAVDVLNEQGGRTPTKPGGWVRLHEDVELDVSDVEIAREYRLALAQGDLWPANQATADFANAGGFAERVTGAPVKFDPLFGAEPEKPKTKKEG